MSRLLYKPFSIAAGVLGGLVAGMLFKRVWRAVTDEEEEAPDARSKDHGWGEVLSAAALQGAIFAVVKAAVDRGGAAGVKRLTGTWPG